MLASRLREAREAAGMNQREVADRLGIGSHSILSELENGQRRLDVVELISLAALYGRSPAWFLGTGAGGAAECTPAGEREPNVTGHITIGGSVGGSIDFQGRLEGEGLPQMAASAEVPAAEPSPRVVEITAQVDAGAEIVSGGAPVVGPETV